MAWGKKTDWSNVFKENEKLEVKKAPVYVYDESLEKNDETVIEIKYDNIQIDEPVIAENSEKSRDSDTESKDSSIELTNRISLNQLKKRLDKIVDEYSQYHSYLRNVDSCFLIDIFRC
jgi:hypothetical protein